MFNGLFSSLVPPLMYCFIFNLYVLKKYVFINTIYTLKTTIDFSFYLILLQQFPVRITSNSKTVGLSLRFERLSLRLEFRT